MTSRFHPGLHIATLAAVAASALLASCDKTTTVTQTPNGTVTTTIAPSLQASQAIGEINASLAHAASAIQSSDAASQALSKTGDLIEDGVITTTVKAALLADPDVKSLRIDVDTRGGAVTLSGTVDKSANLERAARIARDTRGVKSVDNQLVVKPAA